LRGELAGRNAAFVLTGSAIVKHPDGGTLAVLSGVGNERGPGPRAL